MRYILPKSLARLSSSSSRVVSLSKKLYFYENIKTKAFLLVLSASYSSATRLPIEPTKIMCKTTAGESFSTSLWDGSDKESFYSLEHPGYSLESNPENFTGGWLAHRKVWEKTEDDKEDESSECWVKEVIPDITKFDYESMEIGRAPRILVLYGSLRPTSFSRKAGRFCRLDRLR